MSNIPPKVLGIAHDPFGSAIQILLPRLDPVQNDPRLEENATRGSGNKSYIRDNIESAEISELELGSLGTKKKNSEKRLRTHAIFQNYPSVRGIILQEHDLPVFLPKSAC